jgi:FkbM family methyltransferase
MTILFDDKLGFFYREETTHLDTVREPPREYAALEPGPNDRILDIGAHVGGFMGWAHSRGTRTIWSVEPAPDTFEVLEMNHAHRKKMTPDADLRIFNAAAVADPAPEKITLWMTKNHKSKASSMASVQHARGREGVDVPALSFRKLIDDLKPTAIKIDIEGGEYFLDFSNLPDHVNKLAFEMHWVQRDKERAKALHIAETVESQGFREVITGRLGKPFREKLGWNWQIVFTR